MTVGDIIDPETLRRIPKWFAILTRTRGAELVEQAGAARYIKS